MEIEERHSAPSAEKLLHSANL